MEPNQKKPSDQNNGGTMTAEKTNEDFNKKQPDPKDPNETKVSPAPEIPDSGIEKKEKPEDIRMTKDVNPEELTEDDDKDEVGDNGNGAEIKKESPVEAGL